MISYDQSTKFTGKLWVNQYRASKKTQIRVQRHDYRAGRAKYIGTILYPQNSVSHININQSTIPREHSHRRSLRSS